jgi:hypothetical protein
MRFDLWLAVAAMSLALFWAGAEAGERHARRQCAELRACLVMCEADDDGDPNRCPALCAGKEE